MSTSEISIKKKLDAICDQFENAWSIGEPADIVSFLGQIDQQHRDRLMLMLIEVDVDLRNKNELSITSAEYSNLGEQAVAHVEELLNDDLDVTIQPSSASKADSNEETETYPPTKTDQSNRQIGPYKLLQQIGEGGMGSVWMAEQEEPVRRRVALKLIRADMGSKETIARFEAERQALAMMDHQNIAKVLDAGTTDDGNPFFVMELVKGIPLTQYCDENKLSINERLELFIPVCNAIQHAHQKGIIHRDLKPSNVLVTLYDGKPVPKVIDFGLAKALEHTTKLTDKTMFTEFGKVVGTVQYMAPEQAEMNALDVDTRTDVYSLGVMLYELLTGSTPLDKETVGQNALLQILAIIREKEPPRPSNRLSSSGDSVTGISEQRKITPAKLQQILRGELDWIVMKALEKDRTRRYESATNLAQDLERYLNDETVSARPPSASYRFAKFVKKHRAAVFTISAIMLLLIAGIVGTSYGMIWALDASELAKEEAGNARDAEDKAKENEEEAKKQKQAATMTAKEAKQNLLANYLNVGTNECLADRIDEGLGWYARALELANDDPKAKNSVVRLMSSWMDRLSPRILTEELVQDIEPLASGHIASLESNDSYFFPTFNQNFSLDFGTCKIIDIDTQEVLKSINDVCAIKASRNRHYLLVGTKNEIFEELEGPDGKTYSFPKNGVKFEIYSAKTLDHTGLTFPKEQVFSFVPRKYLIVGDSIDSEYVRVSVVDLDQGGLVGEPLKLKAEFKDGKPQMAMHYIGNSELVVFSITDKTLEKYDLNSGQKINSFECETVRFNTVSDRFAKVVTTDGGSATFDLDQFVIFEKDASDAASEFDDPFFFANSNELYELVGSYFKNKERNLVGIRNFIDEQISVLQSWDHAIAPADWKYSDILSQTQTDADELWRKFFKFNGVVTDNHIDELIENRTWIRQALLGPARLEILRYGDGNQSQIVDLPQTAIQLQVSKDAKTICTAAMGGAIEIRALKSGQLLRKMNLGGEIRLIKQFGLDSFIVATDYQILKFSPQEKSFNQNQTNRERLGIQELTTTCLAFSSTGRLVTGDQNGCVTVLDLSSGQATQLPAFHISQITCCDITPDGEIGVTASDRGIVQMWDLQKNKASGHLLTHSNAVSAVAISPDKCFLFAAANGILHRWDLKTGEKISSFEYAPGVEITALQFSHDGKLLAIGDAFGYTSVVDLIEQAHLTKTPISSSRPVRQIEFHPREPWFAINSDALRQYSLDSLKPVSKSMRNELNLASFAYTDDGNVISAVISNGTLLRWDAATGHQMGLPIRLNSPNTSWVGSLPSGKLAVCHGTRIVSYDLNKHSSKNEFDHSKLVPILTGKTWNEFGELQMLPFERWNALRNSIGSAKISAYRSEQDIITQVSSQSIEYGQSNYGTTQEDINKLRSLMLACHNFHDSNDSFPQAYSKDETGKPLLSWRVHLLPFMDQDELYKKFKLDEPWDSEHNIKLLDQMPGVFKAATVEKSLLNGHTLFVAPFSGNTAISNSQVKFEEIYDGSSNTVGIVMARPQKSVPWTAPQDIEISNETDFPSVLHNLVTDTKTGVTAVAFCDASVHILPLNNKVDFFHLCTINDGVSLGDDFTPVPNKPKVNTETKKGVQVESDETKDE